MAGSLHDLDMVEVETLQVLREPLRRLAHVAGMSRISAEARNPQQLVKLAAELLRLLARVGSRLIGCLCHDEFLPETIPYTTMS